MTNPDLKLLQGDDRIFFEIRHRYILTLPMSFSTVGDDLVSLRREDSSTTAGSQCKMRMTFVLQGSRRNISKILKTSGRRLCVIWITGPVAKKRLRCGSSS